MERREEVDHDYVQHLNKLKDVTTGMHRSGPDGRRLFNAIFLGERATVVNLPDMARVAKGLMSYEPHGELDESCRTSYVLAVTQLAPERALPNLHAFDTVVEWQYKQQVLAR